LEGEEFKAAYEFVEAIIYFIMMMGNPPTLVHLVMLLNIFYQNAYIGDEFAKQLPISFNLTD